MKLLVSVVVLCVVIVTLDAAHTTHHPHVTKHHAGNHGNDVAFFYDASSHYLVMKKTGYCYFMALTDAEEQSVHNPDSLRSLEIQALNMHASSSHFAMTGSDHTHISRYVYTKLCVNEHLIKLVQ